MAQVTITINSREYGIACEDGQEGRIFQLSRILDDKAKMLTNGANQINENMLLAMVGLLLADELTELKKNKPVNEAKPQINTESLERIDNELAETIKTLNSRLKTLANEINLI